jgi:PAS domain S-box-containing protein
MPIKDINTKPAFEDRFLAIVEQSPFSIQISSPDGFTVRVNKAWEQLWGLTIEQIKGYNMLEDEQLVKNGVMPYIKSAFAGHYAEIPPILYDPNETLPHLTSHTEEPQRWTKAVIYPIKNSAGEIQEIVLVHQDITAEKIAEEKIKSSESRYRSLFETTLDGIMIVDEQGKYIDVNESLCRILKAPRERLIGSHFSEYMIPERLDEARNAFVALRETGHFTGDFPIRAADGSVVEIAWSSQANFMPGLHVCVARDISERKKAEDNLRISELRNRNLLENANDIIYSHDLEGNYLSINAAGEKITGYSREDILGGMNIAQIIVPEHLELAKQMTLQKLDDASPTVYEVDIIAKDGRRLTLEVSTRIEWVDGNPTTVEGVARDVTQRKQAEREKAQLAEQIEKQRKHLQEMVSNVPGVVWEAWGKPDAQSQQIDFVSDYVEKMLGYTVEEWLATPNFWLTIVHPDDKEIAASNASETFASQRAGTNRFRWITKNGRAIWVEAQSIAILDEAGNPIGMRGVTMDISERKQKEINQQFLAEASTTLASSLDYETTLSSVAQLAVPHFADWCSVDIANEKGTLDRLAVAHIDPDKIVWAQEINERYPPDPTEPQGLYNVFRTGVSEFYPDIPDEMLVQSARDEEHLEIMRQIGFCSAMMVPLKTRGRISGVLTFVNSDGKRHHTPEDLSLAEDLANRAALAVDNARLYRAEQQIRLAAERTSDLLKRLQSVSESLSQALTPAKVADAIVEQAVNSLGAHAGTVVLLDEPARELEIVGAVNFPPGVIKKWNRFSLDQSVPIADSIRTNSPVLIESFAEWSDFYPGLGPLASVTGSEALAAFPLIVENRTIGALGLSFPAPQKFTEDDKSFMMALSQQCAQALERARLYETEQKLRTQAEAANQTKDEFLATVSHELRTPLNAILGWSQMLKTGNLDSAIKDKALTTIERNARAQTQLIDDLLDISRIITGKLRLDVRAVDLSSVVLAAADAARPAAEAKGIRLQTLLDSKAGPISGDPDRLQQVVWNLLSNAVKFTPKNGRVQLRLERVNSHVEIVVSDTGIGIEEEFLPHVFDRFRQLDGSKTRRHGGLGLGLAIVRQLVELHGGTVSAENNNERQGSVFSVKLPLLPVRKKRRSNDSAPIHSPTQSSGGYLPDCPVELAGLHVLLVDDEADSRELLSHLLTSCGAQISTAKSAAEAFELLQQQRFDVVVSDIGMPDEDGFSLIGKVRNLSIEQGGNVPAIALTAYARAEDRIQALRSGFQMHISKPVEPSELVVAVANLGGRMRGSEQN